jgi:HJR/Mrr/RecB family endonuclease
MAETPMLINGAVSGPKRQDRVNLFQDRAQGFDVFILSPRAGGVGLTLTAANHVIHLSRWWNPAVEDQCTDRVYRIGQDKDVHVYYPRAIHPGFGEQSFDLRLSALLDEKRQLSREMLLPPVNPSNDTNVLFGAAVRDSGEDDNSSVLALIDEMEPLGFEDWVMDGLRSAYQVSRTPRTGDRGADIIARDPIGARSDMIVQCKHTQTENPCSEEAVQDLLRAMDAYPLNNPNLVAVTNAATYVARAKSMAQEHGIRLIAREELPNWPNNILR